MCVVAALLVLTGCSGEPAESPGPPPFVGVELPPRPRDVDVRGIDPCTLLTGEQRAELGLNRPPIPTSNADGSDFFQGPTMVCTWVTFEPRIFDVTVELTYDGLGIGSLTGRPVTGELTVLDVQGFPAVLGRPRDPLFCEVQVDLAPGSALSLMYRDGVDGRIPQDELCEGVQQVADAATRTLLGLA